MRLRIPTRGCHLYIMIDLNTFFSSMDAVIRRNILQRYDRGVSLTLLILIRLRDHSTLHLLSVSHDACIYDIDLSTKLLSYILIPIVIGSFYLSLYKTFYNLKPSFLLGIQTIQLAVLLSFDFFVWMENVSLYIFFSTTTDLASSSQWRHHVQVRVFLGTP